MLQEKEFPHKPIFLSPPRFSSFFFCSYPLLPPGRALCFIVLGVTASQTRTFSFNTCAALSSSASPPFSHLSVSCQALTRCYSCSLRLTNTSSISLMSV